MTRILVGVDTSDASVEALRRAVDEARWRDATLELLYAFSPPEPIAGFPVPVERGTDKVDMDAEYDKARDHLATWLDDLRLETAGLEVEWTVVADKRPSRALVDRSAEADLVVVGSRGRGGFAGLRLGSVSEQVARHAHCPVLIVRRKAKQQG
jgi:nucleotide-binding universal stress UspA family protein